MEVILKADVKGLGKKGDKVKVVVKAVNASKGWYESR